MSASDSERSDASGTEVELGFLRQVDPGERWKLHRCYFPSKLGGKPAWLNPENLPCLEEVKCSLCEKPMVFLLQIYAPNDGNENSFHRTIFIFCCKTEACYETNSNLSFCVFRCQLKRENNFYESNPPNYDSPDYSQSCKEFSRTCESCGCKGDKVCSRCHKVSYCCKEHQAIDWKRHKRLCGKADNWNDKKCPAETNEDLLFPENEIVIECEEVSDDDHESADLNPGMVLSGGLSPSELEQFANLSPTDKQFSAFQKLTRHSPDQVLRYDKGGGPLWCSSENQLKAEDIPECHCGSPRQFEFQVMPQLLNHLNIRISVEGPNIDWGILAVYTCEKDCLQEGKSYLKEYLHKQDFSQAPVE